MQLQSKLFCSCCFSGGGRSRYKQQMDVVMSNHITNRGNLLIVSILHLCDGIGRMTRQRTCNDRCPHLLHNLAVFQYPYPLSGSSKGGCRSLKQGGRLTYARPTLVLIRWAFSTAHANYSTRRRPPVRHQRQENARRHPFLFAKLCAGRRGGSVNKPMRYGARRSSDAARNRP